MRQGKVPVHRGLGRRSPYGDVCVLKVGVQVLMESVVQHVCLVGHVGAAVGTGTGAVRGAGVELIAHTIVSATLQGSILYLGTVLLRTIL